MSILRKVLGKKSESKVGFIEGMTMKKALFYLNIVCFLLVFILGFLVGFLVG
jgi:hypothetical protein